MIEIGKILLLSFITILVDSIYLNLSSGHYKSLIYKIQGSKLKMDYISAMFAYILIVFTIYYFVIERKLSYKDSFILGFCIYGIYEFTNKAIIKNWDWFSVVLDTIWGGLLYLIVYYLYKKLEKNLYR
jgi:uncharacterized membrane protein